MMINKILNYIGLYSQGQLDELISNRVNEERTRLFEGRAAENLRFFKQMYKINYISPEVYSALKTLWIEEQYYILYPFPLESTADGIQIVLNALPSELVINELLDHKVIQKI